MAKSLSIRKPANDRGTIMDTIKTNDNAVEDVKSEGKQAAKEAKQAGKDIGDQARGAVQDVKDAVSEDIDTDAVKQRVKDRVDSAKSTLADVQSTMRDRMGSAMSTTDDYVRERPWQTVGMAAGIAFLFGIIIGRS